MAHLIYRGISHTGIQTTTPRTAQALLYRGVSHDGVTANTPHRARTAQMCYRGVRYIALRAGLAQAIPASRDITVADVAVA